MCLNRTTILIYYLPALVSSSRGNNHSTLIWIMEDGGIKFGFCSYMGMGFFSQCLVYLIQKLISNVQAFCDLKSLTC